MKYLLPVVLGAALLSGCAMYKGQVVQQVQFKLDGGKTASFPMVRGGALPAENEDYKIEEAGYFAELTPGSIEKSVTRQTFTLFVKKGAILEYVRIEQVDTTDGHLQLVLQDDAPVLKDQRWFGRSKPIALNIDVSPWLYNTGNSTFLFKFTIKAKDSPAIVMYQPLFFSKAAKDFYMSVLRGAPPGLKSDVSNKKNHAHKIPSSVAPD